MIDQSASLEGIIPVLPVPFTPDQAVDLPAFDRLARWSVRKGVAGLSVFGLASEYWRLDDAEKLQLAERLVEVAEGAVPVALSVTDNSRICAERGARAFVRLGAGAIIVMPPFFMVSKADKLVDHCCAVADAVAPVPVMVQYSPAYVPVSMSADTFVRMHQRSPNIRYVKVEPRPPGPMIDAIRAASGGAIRCLIGQGGLSLADCRRRGIAGLMPGIAILEVHRRLWNDLELEAPAADAWECHDRMVALISHVVPSIDLWASAEKQMLVWRGVLEHAILRDPGALADSDYYRELCRLFDRLRPYLDGESDAA